MVLRYDERGCGLCDRNIVATFCLLGVAAGVRSPVSSGLGLGQLPRHPGAMMAARTAATQLGYVIGAAVGGVVISHGGYATPGTVLAIGMAGSAVLILGVDDRLELHAPADLGVDVRPGRFSEGRVPSVAAP